MRSTEDTNAVHFIFEVPDINAFGPVLETPEVGGGWQKAGVLEQPVMYQPEELPH